MVPLNNDPELPDVRVPAGFWKRFWAFLVDSLIISVAGFVIIIPVLLLSGLGLLNPGTIDQTPDLMALLTVIVVVLILLMTLAQWLYYAVLESAKGATVGKMAMGIRVTDLYGNRPTFGRATGRYFARIASSLTLGVGYLMAGFTRQKQALHDIIAGCLILNEDH
jgi:uncharacterized RDD family membrane protein YckC